MGHAAEEISLSLDRPDRPLVGLLAQKDLLPVRQRVAAEDGHREAPWRRGSAGASTPAEAQL